MVITQRVTSLAYSLQDTMTQKEINANGSHSSVGQLSTKIEKSRLHWNTLRLLWLSKR